MAGDELTQADLIAYLREHREHLRRKYHVHRVAVIGSFARNEQHSGSDVDLLVDLESGTPDIHRLKRELRAELEGTFSRRVEIASERYLKPYYRDQILREAVYV